MELSELLQNVSLSPQIPDLTLNTMLLRVGSSLLLGFWLSLLIRWTHPKRNTSKRGRGILAMQHTHIFLCMSGAFVMIIIGGSLANAFGLSGALNMIRFRTNLIDPKDAALIIVLISVGMACGLELLLPAIVVTLITSLLLLFMWAHQTWNENHVAALKSSDAE